MSKLNDQEQQTTNFKIIIPDIVIFSDNNYKKKNYTDKKELHSFNLTVNVPLKGIKGNFIKLAKSSQSIKVKFAAEIRKNNTDEQIEKLAFRDYEKDFIDLFPDKESDNKPKNYKVSFLISQTKEQLNNLLEITTNEKDKDDIKTILEIKKLQEPEQKEPKEAPKK